MKSDDKGDVKPTKPAAARHSDRKVREAAALRANLRRRKEQQRGRQMPPEKRPDGGDND